MKSWLHPLHPAVDATQCYTAMNRAIGRVHTRLSSSDSDTDESEKQRINDAIYNFLSFIKKQRETRSALLANASPQIPDEWEDATFEDDFHIMEQELFMDMSEVAGTVDEATNVFSELVDYPLSMGVTTFDNLAAVLQTIPQMIPVSGDVSQSLTDTAQAMSMPNMASLGISVGFNYLDGLINIISGVTLIMDEEDCHVTQNKTKGIAQIIAGALALAVSYNPALEAAVGLGAGAFAGPAFAFMTLVDLINSSVDFYDASKKVSMEGWLDEQVKEINYIDKRIEKLHHKLSELNNKHYKHDDKREHLVDKLNKKINELNKKKNTLTNEFNLRSKIYCYGENENPLSELNNKEYNRRNTFVNSKLKQIKNNQSARLADFKETPTRIMKDNKVYSNANLKPTLLERERSNEIQMRLIEDYKEKRANLILKTLSFIGATLFAIAPFSGPAAPALYASGLIITLFVTGYYIYKHRAKIEEAGNRLLTKMKHTFFKEEEEKKKEIELDTFPLENSNRRLSFAS